jgi:primosomal replication protein N
MMLRPWRIARVSRNRIELIGVVVAPPEVRTTPAGTPVLRIEVSCGEGREVFRLGVVMAGEEAREVGARIAAGATVMVTGMLRGRAAHRVAGAVEVLATGISEVPKGASP